LTYCLAIRVNQGLVLASDSRTHAGIDQVSTFSKMHVVLGDGERMMTLLTAGNLATTQAVVRQIRRDLETSSHPNLKSAQHMEEAAEYVGALSRLQQNKHQHTDEESLDLGASFILAGQIAGRPPQISLIYPEGNSIRASTQSPFLQIGELKYGKPILDRVIVPDLSLEIAARCALVSMDSTMRSNVTVGPPIEVLIYGVDSLGSGERLVFAEHDDYLRNLRAAWQGGLMSAFNSLPALPATQRRMRLVDARGDPET